MSEKPVITRGTSVTETGERDSATAVVGGHETYPVIEQGVQYETLDIGGGRVKKIPQSAQKARQIVARWYGKGLDDQQVVETTDYIAHDREASMAIVRHMTAYYPELGRMLGRPKFEEDGSFTQDKVKNLDTMLSESSNIEEAKELIHRYFGLVQALWMYGIHDKISNFQINCGINGRGDLIFSGFGEITDDKDRVAKLLQDENWQRADDYLRLPDELKEYYKQTAPHMLSAGNLKRLWRVRLNTSQSTNITEQGISHTEIATPDETAPVLGEGLQFKTLDIGNGRVKKVPQSYNAIKKILTRWNGGEDEGVKKHAQAVVDTRGPALKVVENLVNQHPTIKRLFGNPEFEEDGGYTQDKVVMIEKIFKQGDLEKSKATIDRYIDTIQILLSYGVYHTDTNFLINCGMDSHNKVVISDCLDLTQESADVRKKLAEEQWADSRDFKMLPEELKRYYKQEMRKRLNSKTFDEIWGRSVMA